MKLWGIRGSLPTPIPPDQVRWQVEEVLTQYERLRDSGESVSARTFLKMLPSHLAGGYGGNSTCAEVTSGKSRLLIDGGSGVRNFSEFVLRSEPQTEEFHFYFTHFHWDHLIGLPFFTPLYVKGKTVNFYSVDPAMEASLKVLFRKPNFPVPYEAVAPQIRVHQVKPRQPLQLGNLKITPYQLDHPDACWGARIEADGKALAWAVDTECTRVSRQDLGEDLPLYQNADLMVFDAQYSFGEALEKINWGHASGPIGLDLAIREGIKQTLFVHHDPTASDEMIRKAEEQTRSYYDYLIKGLKTAGKKPAEVEWSFAVEGTDMEI